MSNVVGKAGKAGSKFFSRRSSTSATVFPTSRDGENYGHGNGSGNGNSQRGGGGKDGLRHSNGNASWSTPSFSPSEMGTPQARIIAVQVARLRDAVRLFISLLYWDADEEVVASL